MKLNVVIAKKYLFGYYGFPETKKQWFISNRDGVEILLSKEDIEEIYFQFIENGGLK